MFLKDPLVHCREEMRGAVVAVRGRDRNPDKTELLAVGEGRRGPDRS